MDALKRFQLAKRLKAIGIRLASPKTKKPRRKPAKKRHRAAPKRHRAAPKRHRAAPKRHRAAPKRPRRRARPGKQAWIRRVMAKGQSRAQALALWKAIHRRKA